MVTKEGDMGYAIIVLAGLMGFIALTFTGGLHGVIAGGHVSPLPKQPASPLDEAERIVTLRYAKGEITPEEYARMLAILRR